MLYKRCACVDQSKCWHPFSYEFVVFNERYRRSTKTANKQLAGRIETRARNAALEGAAGIAVPEKPARLSEVVETYLEAVEQEHATYNKDKRVLEAFVAFTGDPLITEVSAFLITKWKVARAKDKVAHTTVNRELNILRALFSRAVTWGKLAVSPVADVADFDVDDRRVRVLSDSEIHTILTAAPDALALIFETTLECLLRLSEVLALRKEHIGLTWIEVRRKGGRVDRIPITDTLRTKLLTHAHKNGAVFGEGTKGEPPTQATVSVRVTRLFRDLKIAGASHHTMRHTAVTLMLEGGVNPRAIQRMAGWTSMRMLERYGHVRDAELIRAVGITREYLTTLAPTQGKAAEAATGSK